MGMVAMATTSAWVVHYCKESQHLDGLGEDDHLVPLFLPVSDRHLRPEGRRRVSAGRYGLQRRVGNHVMVT